MDIKSTSEPIKKKKFVPQNIQNAIDKYIIENHVDFENEPKIIELDSYADFDAIKHFDDYIRFRPGGKVGDKEWNLQFMHNCSVKIAYQRKKNKDVFFAPETLIYVDIHRQPKTIDIFIDDLLIDSINYHNMEIANALYDIKPPVDIKKLDSLCFIHLDWLSENDYSIHRDHVKIVVNYLNYEQILTIDDIVIVRY